MLWNVSPDFVLIDGLCLSKYAQLSSAFDFEGSKDVFKFLDIAQSNGLDVIFRGLPYRLEQRGIVIHHTRFRLSAKAFFHFSCGEYTFGGIPPWILTAHPNVTLRRSDPIFMVIGIS